MIKLQTPVVETPCGVEVSYSDKILLLGSCFADSLGKTMTDYGFDTLVNPFGTLYNPASIYMAVSRLASCREFTTADCVPMGAEAGKICSFSHHTSFARPDEAGFLENANASLQRASAFFRECNKVIITLGTAWCFRYIGSSPRIDSSNAGGIVSNCLKRDPKEFSREILSLKGCTALLRNIVNLCGSFGPDADEGETSGQKNRPRARRKEIVFTVSPIRHLADGAHGNQLSKSTLLMAVNEVCPETARVGGIDYFPAYEIMMDELRDYRFYAEDMVHPSAQAAAYIAERFFARHLSSADRPLLQERIRAFKRSLHRPLFNAGDD